MQVIKQPAEIFGFSQQCKKEGKSVGLVPTMGALHDGHLSLVRQAVLQNKVTIVSIFVNPLQFNNSGDLNSYPRMMDADLSLLEKAGVDVVFAPDVQAMYPEKPLVSISFGQMANVMEGEFRPGHFDGVGVVVSKLFNLVNPDNAYFGLKDIQQFLLIKRMVIDLSMPVTLHGMPTMRESSGLAMSSRNKRLSVSGLEIASTIHKGLKLAEEKLLTNYSINETKKAVFDFYRGVEGLSIEYLNVVDAENLVEIDQPNKSLAICVAGYVEGVRLIDNLYLRFD